MENTFPLLAKELYVFPYSTKDGNTMSILLVSNMSPTLHSLFSQFHTSSIVASPSHSFLPPTSVILHLQLATSSPSPPYPPWDYLTLPWPEMTLPYLQY